MQVVLSSDGAGGAPAPAAARITQLLLAAGADPLGHSSRRRCSTLRCACGSEFLPNRTLPLLLDHLEGQLSAGQLVRGRGWCAEAGGGCVWGEVGGRIGGNGRGGGVGRGACGQDVSSATLVQPHWSVPACPLLRLPRPSRRCMHAGFWQWRCGSRGAGGRGSLLPPAPVPGEGSRRACLLHNANSQSCCACRSRKLAAGLAHAPTAELSCSAQHSTPPVLASRP